MAKSKTSLSMWLIFWWVFATVAGIVAAFIVGLPLLLSVDYVGGGNVFLYLGLIATFAVAGALIGLGQWLVLRRHDVGARWIAATAGGAALGGLAIWSLEFVPSNLTPWLAALLLPLAIGIPQALILRAKLANAWYWVGVNYLAFIVFFILLVSTPNSALLNGGLYLSYPLITGAGLWWLLNESKTPAAAHPKRPATKLSKTKKKR
jgi:hypothetical protein